MLGEKKEEKEEGEEEAERSREEKMGGGRVTWPHAKGPV